VIQPLQPRLVVHEPAGRRVVPISRWPFRIGRAADADLQLSGADISREHAVITSDADGFLLVDRSRAGTFINGQRVTEHRLAHGDEIECGRGGAVLMFLTVRAEPERAVPLQVSDLRPMAALLESLRAMGGERVLDEVLALVLDAAIDASGADRGFIMLAEASGQLALQMARGADRATLPPDRAGGISQKIPDQVFASGEPMVVADLLEGDLAEVHTGTVALGIRHVLCVPLRVVRYVGRSSESRADAPTALRNTGVLYLDSRSRGRLLSMAAREEIAALAAEAALAIENARLYQQAVEKVRIDRELATASRIQQALLPEPRRAAAFFEAVGTSIPSRTIGGDFFDYQDLPDGTFRIAIGDITGKGPPAALLAALVQGLLASEAAALRAPDELIASINRVLLARPLESRFVSLFLGQLAPDGRLEYCNAGQNPPLLFSSGGTTRLEAGGTLVGAFPQATFQRGTVMMTPGDVLVLYSDGVSEAENPAGEEFGDEGIRRAVAPVASAAPQRVLDALFTALQEFTASAVARDDMTAIVLRYAPG
jgi:serine phosphatase RsbU (regulator of sigma subunit)/pSer/pThr/pTyr-binding forkhead associated (FHA) protein